MDNVTPLIIGGPDRRILAPLQGSYRVVTTERVAQAGTFSVTVPADTPSAVALLTEKNLQLEIPGRTGEAQLFGGQMTFGSAEVKPKGKEDITAAGIDDLALLGDRIVYPEPFTETPATAYYRNTTDAASHARNMVDFNCALSALAPRRIPNLEVEIPAFPYGSTQPRQWRWHNLLEAVAEVCLPEGLVPVIRRYRTETGITLRFELKIIQPRNDTQLMVLPRNGGTGNLERAAPTATYVLVAGDGEGAARRIGTAVAPNADWGRRIEKFVDRRDVEPTDPLEPIAASVAALNTETVSVEAKPVVHGVGVVSVGDVVPMQARTGRVMVQITEVKRVWTPKIVATTYSVGRPMRDLDRPDDLARNLHEATSRLAQRTNRLEVL